MKIQVISKDEYGTTVILETVEDVETARSRIHREVTDLNFENSLTTIDKFKSLEAYFPELIDDSGDVIVNLIYAGNSVDGKHRFYEFDEEGNNDIQVFAAQGEPRFYLGTNENEVHFMEDARSNVVNNFGHELLEGKQHYFVKVI